MLDHFSAQPLETAQLNPEEHSAFFTAQTVCSGPEIAGDRTGSEAEGTFALGELFQEAGLEAQIDGGQGLVALQEVKYTNKKE